MSNGSCLLALWQLCLINTLHFLQLSSSFQTGRGWGIESPESRIRLCTKLSCRGGEAWASRSSLGELGWTQELLNRDIVHSVLVVCNNYWFHCRNHLQKGNQPFTLFCPLMPNFCLIHLSIRACFILKLCHHIAVAKYRPRLLTHNKKSSCFSSTPC